MGRWWKGEEVKQGIKGGREGGRRTFTALVVLGGKGRLDVRHVLHLAGALRGEDRRGGGRERK